MDKTLSPILSFILLLPSSTCHTSIGGKAVLTCVGVMWLMSSDASCFRRVVLPALSKPRRRILTSWSGALFNLRKIESKPLNNHEEQRLLWRHWLWYYWVSECLLLLEKSSWLWRAYSTIFHFNVIYSICL